MGYRVVFAPKAIVYHLHHGSWGKKPPQHRMTLLERNAFYTVIKNYEQQNLEAVLPLALLLAIKRSLVDAGINREEYKPGYPDEVRARKPTVKVPKITFCPLVALEQVMDNLPLLLEKRRAIQSVRRRSDGEFFSQFAQGLLNPNRTEPVYVTAYEALLKTWNLPDFFRQPASRRLLLVCHDTIGEKMAGPGMRYWELAQVLSRHFEVTLAAPGLPGRHSDEFHVTGYRRADDASIAPLVARADAIMAISYLVHELPSLALAGKPLILDLYVPYTLESLETYAHLPLSQWQRKQEELVAVLNHQLQVGDFYVCASERQRHYWLGMLVANNRINPSTYDQDKTLQSLIDLVPFGLPMEPPQHTRQVLKGVYPGIGPDDKVILWGGGIWNWFDPLTLIRAVGKVVHQRPDVKLFFMGRGHFDPTVVPDQPMADRAVKLSRELGLLDHHVFFGDWVDYEERQNYLLEADIGASLHFINAETRFAFRTRLLDYIWASLPTVTTRGDGLSELMGKEGLAKVVEPEDVGGVTEAILTLLDEPGLRERLEPDFDRVARQFHWEVVAEPIIRFCQQPRRAPDHAWLKIDLSTVPQIGPTSWWALPGRAWLYLQQGGPGYLWQGVKTYFRWLQARRWW